MDHRSVQLPPQGTPYVTLVEKFYPRSKAKRFSKFAFGSSTFRVYPVRNPFKEKKEEEEVEKFSDPLKEKEEKKLLRNKVENQESLRNYHFDSGRRRVDPVQPRQVAQDGGDGGGGGAVEVLPDADAVELAPAPRAEVIREAAVSQQQQQPSGLTVPSGRKRQKLL